MKDQIEPLRFYFMTDLDQEDIDDIYDTAYGPGLGHLHPIIRAEKLA